LIEELLKDAVNKGAVIHCGGKRYTHPKYPKGQYFEPTVISNVSLNMRIAHEEVFGPVLVIYSFSTEEESIQIANCSQFGLGCGVFTADYERAKRVTKAIKTGMSNINAFGTNYLCQGLPFGGVGISGVDCFSGVEGLRGQCIPKATTEDRFNWLRTTLPLPLQYPLKKTSPLFQQAVAQILYSSSWRCKILAVKEILFMAFGKTSTKI
jgi:acyl-CoA reductase-like NAD-dependent aldehyde dehydrogenase